MSNKDAVMHVLSHMKQGKIVGTSPLARTHLSELVASGSNLNFVKKPLVLKYRSYNPSLNKLDFLNLLPDHIAHGSRNHFNGFELIKYRDPRFFQFKDKYMLLFKDYKSLKLYHESTKLEKINKVRVKFDIETTQLDRYSSTYIRYANNLLAANESSQSYFESIKEREQLNKIPAEISTLSQFDSLIKPIEEKSAIVWNLPNHLLPTQIADMFWFYDIKRCFKLYWNNEIENKTLHYFLFNDSIDCLKFKRNFHGVYLNEEDPTSKLLVERLN